MECIHQLGSSVLEHEVHGIILRQQLYSEPEQKKITNVILKTLSL